MSGNLLNILIGIVIIGHGIGHVMGLMSALGFQLTPQHSSNSWLFTRLLGRTASRAVMFIIFAAATIFLIAGGLGSNGWLLPFDRWAWLTASGSILSIAGLVLFPKAFPTVFPNLVGAVAVDIAALLTIYWWHWPSPLFN
jgi:hypothetical protein